MMLQSWLTLGPLSAVACFLSQRRWKQSLHTQFCSGLLSKGMATSRSLQSELRLWNELNLGVQHHSGFVAMCLGLGVIATGGHLDLGTEESMCKLVDDSTGALRKLEKMSAAWKAVSPVLCVPKTCSQWRQCMLDCMEVLAERGAQTPTTGSTCRVGPCAAT